MIEFDDGQRKALNQLANGKILCGDVGSGKSRTSLAYYFVKECGGSFEPTYIPMKNPKPLVIITTAKKRDSGEWEEECKPFGITDYIIDSWNNIKKYESVKDSFFIFDEQRVVGTGAWVKAFYKITKENQNRWILLSATPGDNWCDYIPVFVANGFYKNKTAFQKRHCQFNRYSKFPKIDRYWEEDRLEKMRDYLLVDIEVKKTTTRHYEDIIVDYDLRLFKLAQAYRVNPFTDEPITDAAQLCYTLRKIVNMNDQRINKIVEMVKDHPRIIIFYNFDYELEMLREMCAKNNYTVAEWNGHKHEKIPNGDNWLYLVQYSSGAEGWNCVTTDTIIFFSLNYSYRMTMQSCGRIDRRNTQYKDLYYYFLRTNSWIDRAIKKALNSKKNFNERSYFTGICYA